MRMPKHLLTVFYGLLATAVLSAILYLFFGTRHLIDAEGMRIGFSLILLYFLVPIGLLVYGLYKSRGWVVVLHGTLAIFWLVFWTTIALVVVPTALRFRDPAWLPVIFVGFALPISIQWYLIRNREEVLESGVFEFSRKRLTIVVASLYLAPVLLFGLLISPFVLVGLHAPERSEIRSIENGRYRVVAYFFPSTFVTTDDATTIVYVDKTSIFKTEHRLWSESYLSSFDLSFLDSSTVQLVRRKSHDSLVFDLKHPSDFPIEEDETPPWRHKLNYDGCIDVCTIENSDYAVTFRKYPPGKLWGGCSRLIVHDKHAWFTFDKILMETGHEDSIGMHFTPPDSVTVTVQFLDPIHRQGAVRISKSQKTYSLSSLKSPMDGY